MTTATKQPAIYAALAAIQEDLHAIPKDQKTWAFKFRGIDTVMKIFHPLFKRHRVAFQCRERIVVSREIIAETKNGERRRQLSELVAYFSFMSLEDGSVVPTCSSAHGSDPEDKGLSAAGSTAYRAALLEFFCVPTEDLEDNDQRQQRREREEAAAQPQENARPDVPPQRSPREELLDDVLAKLQAVFATATPEDKSQALTAYWGVSTWPQVKGLPDGAVRAGYDKLLASFPTNEALA